MLHYNGDSVPIWEIFEIDLPIEDIPDDPFKPCLIVARFESGDAVKRVEGYYAGNGHFRVRFMPQRTGAWKYTIDGIAHSEGSFTCLPQVDKNVHGPVSVIGTDFAYEDGTKYLPYGTTCYAWAHQTDEMRTQTIATLQKSPFNKLRMCIFPKHYKFNLSDPKLPPFESVDDGFDEMRPNPAYFDWMEESVEALCEIGVIADIILFHPYDRWGYSTMSPEADERYLHYAIARLGAYRNIWWSMANEYDLFLKRPKDWRHIGETVRACDPYGHPRSIHNCRDYYDHSEDWITHCSLQRIDVYRHVEDTDALIMRWNKPVVWDEIAYEGNVFDGWGSITGEEMTRRFWESVIRGGYPGHGETILPPDGGADDSKLWWSHGGELRGESPMRINFLKRIHEQEPVNCEFWQAYWDLIGRRSTDGGYYLFYHSFMRPIYRYYPVKAGNAYRVEVIDTWDMTITDMGVTDIIRDEAIPFVRQPEGYASLRVKLPGKPFIAVRITKV